MSILYLHKKELDLSKSAIKILDVLAKEPTGLGIHEIKDKLNVSKRTVHYGLKNLLAKDVVKKIPNLSDLRQSSYRIDLENLRKLEFESKILMYRQFMRRIS